MHGTIDCIGDCQLWDGSSRGIRELSHLTSRLMA
jgi:hypothetical protein